MRYWKGVLVGAVLALALCGGAYYMLPKPLASHTPISPAEQPPAQGESQVGYLPQPYKLTDGLVLQFVKKHIVTYGRSNPTAYQIETAKTLDEPIPSSESLILGSQDEIVVLGAVLPVSRTVFGVTSSFGQRLDPFTHLPADHDGLDIGGVVKDGRLLIDGQPVRAFQSGKVEAAGPDPFLGNRVVIDHGSFKTVYGHLQSIADIEAGADVKAGEPLGKAGNTGRSTAAHLHFGIIVDGQAVDPMPYLAPLLK